MGKFSLLEEDDVCGYINQRLREWFGESVSLENIPQKTCLISLERPEGATGVEIISTSIKSLRTIKGERGFQVYLSLGNGYEIQLAVVRVKDIPNKEVFVEGSDLLRYCTAEDQGWHPCLIDNLNDSKKRRVRKGKELRSLFLVNLLPFNAIMKIV
jgi:hypothetical protein